MYLNFLNMNANFVNKKKSSFVGGVLSKVNYKTVISVFLLFSVRNK